MESSFGIISIGPIRVDFACKKFPDKLDPSYSIKKPEPPTNVTDPIKPIEPPKIDEEEDSAVITFDQLKA